MLTVRRAPLGLAAVALLAAGAGRADTVKLTLVPTGAMPKIGYYMPQRLELTDKPPALIKKAPDGLTAPIYGVITFGPKEHPRSFAVIVDEPDGKDARLFVDSNGDGDLTNDPPAEWKKSPYKDNTGKSYAMYMGGAMVHLGSGTLSPPVHLGIYRFDKSDPNRAALKTAAFYYRDYAYSGQMRLGSKAYKVMVADEMATGDFRGKPDAKSSGVSLLIDVNGNGRFDARGEQYDITKPFNIKGTTYQIVNISPSGASFQVVKSKQQVAEILPPPDTSAGHKAITFYAVTTDNRAVNFPSSYKGKVVMLDFWATWCGPCRGELPYLTKAYETYHPKGFEVLGISLDQANAGPTLTSFTKENKMPWPQVYDGKFWDAKIAKLYVVQSIPQAFLVDGDTGAILAEGENLRGEKLAPAIEKALARKTGKASAKPDSPAEKSLLTTGMAAPDFVVDAWGGGTTHLSDYRGKVVVLDFWATWCPPCRASMPHLERVYQAVKDKDVAVLGLCSFDAKDAYEKWIPENKDKYHFAFAFDPGERNKDKSIGAHLYNVTGIPTTYIIDKEGKVVDAIVGYSGEEDTRIEAALKKLGVDTGK